MCTVSMIGETFRKRYEPEPWYPWPQVKKIEYPDQPFQPNISKQEFEDLKKEVKLLKDLLKAAKAYDVKNNEPNCENDEKMKLLKKIAKAVGVDLDEVLKPASL